MELNSHHRLTETVCNAGGDQSFADDRHRGNQGHHWLAEACQRFLYRQHAAQIQRQNHEDRDHIGAHAPGREQHDGASQNGEYGQHVLCHRAYPFG
jgi:phospholipase/lecithinase/hemolysin